MSALFEMKDVDKRFYDEKLSEFLPDSIIDIHTHVWKKDLMSSPKGTNAEKLRVQSWPSKVAAENPIEDLQETYRLMFPGKTIKPLIFATVPESGLDELNRMNDYVAECSRTQNVPALIFSHPDWTAKELERKIDAGGFLGVKSYLALAPAHLDGDEIRVFDYFPRHQLEVMDKRRMIVMCHIPRSTRLGDPQTLADMLEIERDFPNLSLIIAHVGRAYCEEDVGAAFETLEKSEKILFDFSANTNDVVFEGLIHCVGPERILFGSDMPILRMRTRRICENGRYVNLVPKGVYGDVSNDPHMRELEDAEADALTFFMYEEIDAFRRAAHRTGLSKQDIQRVFHDNANDVLKSASGIS